MWKEQAKRVSAIYEKLIEEEHANVIVLDDPNDTPDSDQLQPLLNTSLKDISEHPGYDTGEFEGRGTFGLGNDKD